MATSSGSITSSGSLLSVTGLASGLDTGEIIKALMEAERQPVTRMTDREWKLQGEQKAVETIKTSLQQLVFAAAEFDLPSLFEGTQSVSSSEPARVGAVITGGAGIGGYEVEVTKLANSAQRTFTFTSPAAEETITIDGQEFTVKAGETAKELARAITSSSTATVYAAALENGRIVLSSRETGASAGEFIQVEDAGETLVEVENTAKEGQDAEFTIDGVAETSASNTVTSAIPGVTLTLQGTTAAGAVTIDVQPPSANVANVEEKVQAFITAYNSTIEAIHTQLTTKPPEKPKTQEEFETGTLFGDLELQGLLNNIRAIMYEPISGLEAGMSSMSDIGVSTGAATGGASSQASLEGILKLQASKLAEAVKANPTGVKEMVQQWSQKMQSELNTVGGPGGGLASRALEDAAQITDLQRQIVNMNEILLQKERALQETYAKLEAAISQSTAQSNWLTEQTESMFG